MFVSKQWQSHEERTKENLAKIRNGDVVQIIEECWEHEFYGEKEFNVISEPRKIGASYCVRLDGIGYFDIAMIKKVEKSKEKVNG